MSVYKKFLREKRRHNLKETISLREKYLLWKKVPFQKILGFIDFDNLKIRVNKKVLIPRYETQEVVNFVLEKIDKNSEVLDLCAGSGYIGLTLKQKTNCKVVLSDISNKAIKQMKINSNSSKLEVKIVKSNLFENIKQTFDVIVSNPPYIPLSEKKNLPKEVTRYEPHNALFAKNKGNFFYEQIIKQAFLFLKKNGLLVFEISPYNKKYLKENGFKIIKDINKKERIAFKKY